MKPALISLATALLLACCSEQFAKGQNNGKGNSRAEIYAELGKAPEKARNRTSPLAKDPDAVAAGKLLFEDHCAECHGATAEGGRKGPNLRAPEVQGATPGTIFWLLTNGVVRKGMPVWSRLPEAQRWALVSYLKSLGVSSAPAGELPQPPAKPSAQ